jgi:uncharacterized membrane protein YobD (UPF0266 family)
MGYLSGILVTFNQSTQEHSLWTEILLSEIVLLGSYGQFMILAWENGGFFWKELA